MSADVDIKLPPFAWTEAVLLDALHRRFHTDRGVVRYAFARHVRTSSGFTASNTIDAVAVELWRSKGHDIHAFEVKCSRGDWLGEIRDRVLKAAYTVPGWGTMPERVVPAIIRPALSKSAAARELCDTFSVVAPAGIVKIDELPDRWGLYEASESIGNVALKAARLPKRLDGEETALRLRHARSERDITRSFAVSIMRQCVGGPPE